MSDNKLKERKRLFCVEYPKDFNATEAAKRAGYSKKSAYSTGHELLKKPEIQAEISNQIRDIIERAKIPLKKQILDFWIIRAFYDVTEIVDLNGNLKLTEEQLREKGLQVCIDGIEKKISAQGDVTIKYKFADKDKAVEMLQKYMGMIKEEPPQIQQNNTYIDLKALIFNQSKNPKDKERIIAGLEKLSDFKE